MALDLAGDGENVGSAGVGVAGGAGGAGGAGSDGSASDDRKTRRRRALCCAALFSATAALLLCMGFWLWYSGATLPTWVQWQRVELACDLDGDGAFEAMRVQDGRMEIWDSSGLAYATSSDWRVSNAAAGDIDGDGAMELALLVWKHGSFGPYKPFWVQTDEIGLSQHIFIARYADGAIDQVWYSSALGFCAQGMQLDSYARIACTTAQGEDVLLEWQSFGLAFVTDDNPSWSEAQATTATLLAFGDNIAHDGILQQGRADAVEGGEGGASGEGGEGGEGDASGEGGEGDASNADSTPGASDSSALSAGTRSAWDFSALFAQVESAAQGYDLTAIVQETPLVASSSDVSGYPSFGTPQAMGDAIASAGFDVVCAATNHALDKGASGVEQTLEFWEENWPNVSALGMHASRDDAYSPACREVNGITLAFFDATYGFNYDAQNPDEGPYVDVIGDGEALCAAVASARLQGGGKADAVVCFLHVGEEYATSPTEDVEELARRLVEAGASAVICSHPHVVQRAEWVTGADGARGVVFYSLGNFASNQPYPQTVLGAAASITFEKTFDESGAAQTQISYAAMLPTVCHVADGEASVRWLADYTSSLASSHYVNSVTPDSVTLEGLQAQWSSLATAYPSSLKSAVER